MVTAARQDALSRRVRWSDLDEAVLRALIETARAEDLEGRGLREMPPRRLDVTSALLPATREGSARLVARRAMRLAGLPLLPLIAEAYGGGFALLPAVDEGTALQPGEVIGTLRGNVRQLLSAERVILNFLQRLSGIATSTATAVAALGATRTRLLDTRKTTPGWRLLEKYAVTQGGGWNHRLGLYDQVMLKDNHLAVGGLEGQALSDLVRRARATYPDLVIEVEVDRREQISPVLEAGADVIMLDNFDNAALADAVALIGAQAATEASGGITLERLPSMAGLGLDFISTGATVHQSGWIDIGLDWESVR